MELMKTCQICGKDGRLEGHHLSYEPEKIVTLCIKCHLFLHILPKFDEDQLNKMQKWVTDYGSQWENGTEKYRKSNHRKEYRDNYNQKYLEIHREENKKRCSERYKQKREEINTKKKKAYKENPELRIRIAEQGEKWREANKERIKNRDAGYYAKNRELIRKQQKECRMKQKSEVVW